MQLDKSVSVTEAPLSLEDKKELKRQNVIFLGGTFLLSVVALIIIFLLVYSTLWRSVIAAGFLALIGVFSSSVYSNFTDLKHGKKTIKTGDIWDIYEEFVTQKQGDKWIGKRKFFFRLGDLKHRFYQYSFESESDAKTPQEAADFEVGQTVEIHYTKSGYQLREVAIRVSGKNSDPAMQVIHKITSKRQITQNKPRRWNEKITGDFFYLQVQDHLFAVEEQIFKQVATGATVKAKQDQLSKSNKHIEIQTTDGLWMNVDITSIHLL